jgi:hypothetical protein
MNFGAALPPSNFAFFLKQIFVGCPSDRWFFQLLDNMRGKQFL